MESGDPYLRTLDVAIMKKDFEPITAKFTKNKISRLQNVDLNKFSDDLQYIISGQSTP